ncbi:MAG: serine hydrolase [Chloroflexota bacterium]
MPRSTPSAGRSPRIARPGRRARQESPTPFNLAGLLARALIAFFVIVLGWKLVSFGLATYEEAQFQRSDITALLAPAKPQPFLDSGLEAVVRRAAVAPGKVSVSIRNITTGAQAEVNGEEVFPAASLFKLPVLVEVVKQYRLRRFLLDDQVLIRNEHWTDGSGILQARIGERFPVRELLRLMIAESDNIAALALIDLVGVENINRTMLSIGLEWTKVQDRRSNRLLHVTTARDMGMLLEVLATGQLVDHETSEEAVRLLELKQAQNWLDDRLPWFTRVAHKWGELPSVRHDAGILFTPRSTFVVVVMTQGADVASSGDVISNVSRAAFEYFER